MVVRPSALLWAALLPIVAACASDDGGERVAARSSIPGPVVTVTSPATTGACPALPDVPVGAEESGARQADVDADGTGDQVTTYAISTGPAAGGWRMRVALGAGGGAEYTLPEDPAPGAFKVVGTAYVGSGAEPGPGGSRPLIFAWVSSGASAKVIALYRLDGCTIVPVTFPTGGQATIIAGGSIGHQEGARCEGVPGNSLLVEVVSEAVANGFAITERAYTRAGNALVAYGQTTARTSADPPPEAARIVCDDVQLS